MGRGSDAVCAGAELASGLRLRIAPDVFGVVWGLVWVDRVRVQASERTLTSGAARALSEAQASGELEQSRSLVRGMLRHGRYRPSGRAKPASEYLVKAAVERRFPAVNSLVDAANLVSLRWLVPVSLLDLERAAAQELVLRRGRAGERYVFNAAGQEIGLEDLLLIAREPGDVPCANAVKDSLATKLGDTSTQVVAAVYGPTEMRQSVASAVDELARQLSQAGAASRSETALLASPGPPPDRGT